MGAPTRNSFGTDGVIGDMANPARVEQTWGQVSAQVVLVRLVASVVVTVRRSHGNEELSEEKASPKLQPKPKLDLAALLQRDRAELRIPTPSSTPSVRKALGPELSGAGWKWRSYSSGLWVNSFARPRKVAPPQAVPPTRVYTT